MDFLIAIFPTAVGHAVAVRAGGSGGVFHGYLLRISFQDYVYSRFLLNASIILSGKRLFPRFLPLSMKGFTKSHVWMY